MTSPRLLNTTRSDFERALLRSAITERAPETTRARARESVARALASAGALGASADVSGTGESAGATLAAPARVRWRRGVSLGRLALAAGVALVAGVALLILQRSPGAAPEAGERADASAQRQEAAPLDDPAGERAGTVHLGSVQGATAADAQGALANTRAVTPQFQAEGTLLQTLAEEEAPDWLGAQLQLLGEARRQLEVGALERTQGLLDSYDQRFPGGVVGPQILALRAELQERRQRARAALR